MVIPWYVEKVDRRIKLYTNHIFLLGYRYVYLMSWLANTIADFKTAIFKEVLPSSICKLQKSSKTIQPIRQPISKMYLHSLFKFFRSIHSTIITPPRSSPSQVERRITAPIMASPNKKEPRVSSNEIPIAFCKMNPVANAPSQGMNAQNVSQSK